MALSVPNLHTNLVWSLCVYLSDVALRPCSARIPRAPFLSYLNWTTTQTPSPLGLSLCLANTSSLKQMRDERYTKRRRTKCEIKLSKWKPTLTIFISLCFSLSLFLSSLLLFVSHFILSRILLKNVNNSFVMPAHWMSRTWDIVQPRPQLQTRLQLQLRLQPPPFSLRPAPSLRRLRVEFGARICARRLCKLRWFESSFRFFR